MKWFERLRAAREAKGLKKAHFAKEIGVTAPTVTEWEKGITATPSAANVMNICKVLNITPEWLMGADKSPHARTKTYFGTNELVADAVSILEALPDYELKQALAILRTLSANTAGHEPRAQQ